MITNIKALYVAGVIGLLGMTVSLSAKPWLDTGDMRLRHQLQILSDAGLLDAPITTWPLSSEDIYSRLKSPKEGKPLHPAIQKVLDNVKARLAEEDFGSRFKVGVQARTKELLIRDFSGEGREKSSIYYDGEWGSPILDLRLKASLEEPSSHQDDDKFRLDESYIAASLGNWKITAGRQSRWWGPAWDGSLILSNNARPIPSLSVENISSEPFQSKYLSWLGTSKFQAFVGQLESHRGIPDAKLIGTRFTFRPRQSLEIGLSRTIQWGGEGQDESFTDFVKTLASVRVDRQDGKLGTVRGNQIAGIDARWNLPIGSKDKQYSLYGQYIGEDRVDGSLLLGDEIFLLGGSVSGISNTYQGTWRAYVEATDTSAGSYKGRDRNNIVYNHGSYTDGYRFLDLSMGHGIDSDSKLVSVGAMLLQDNGSYWRIWGKHAKLNEDGVGNNPIAPNGRKWSALGASLDRKISENTSVNVGIQLISDDVYGSGKDNDLAVSVGISRAF